jgi:hypothetical protein
MLVLGSKTGESPMHRSLRRATVDYKKMKKMLVPGMKAKAKKYFV